MLKKIFHKSFENFGITRICMETYKRDWMAKVVFFHTNASNFRRPLQLLLLIHTTEILGLHIFNMLFQLTLTKFFKSELFSFLPKVDHVFESFKEPIN